MSGHVGAAGACTLSHLTIAQQRRPHKGGVESVSGEEQGAKGGDAAAADAEGGEKEAGEEEEGGGLQIQRAPN